MQDLAIRMVEQRADTPDATVLLHAYLGELRKRLGKFDPTLSISAEPDEMTPPTGAFLIVYEGDVAVACGGLKTLDETTGEIKRMYVVPEARSRGYGRRILEALEERARRRGMRRIVLDTAGPLIEAARLYDDAGYSEIPAYNDNPYAARWFEKHL